jgi:hypothetical protein
MKYKLTKANRVWQLRIGDGIVRTFKTVNAAMEYMTDVQAGKTANVA